MVVLRGRCGWCGTDWLCLSESLSWKMSSQKIGVRAIPSLVLQRPVSMLRPPSARSSAHKVQASAPAAAAKSPRPGVQVPKITVPRIPATSSACMRFTQKSTGHETASPRSSMRISGTSKRTLTAAARSERATPAQSQERLDMVASTGTDSSGVYSEPESNKQLKYTPRVAPHVISPRPSASHPSQARCTVTKPAIGKTAKQQTVPNKGNYAELLSYALAIPFVSSAQHYGASWELDKCWLNRLKLWILNRFPCSCRFAFSEREKWSLSRNECSWPMIRFAILLFFLESSDLHRKMALLIFARLTYHFCIKFQAD